MSTNSKRTSVGYLGYQPSLRGFAFPPRLAEVRIPTLRFRFSWRNMHVVLRDENGATRFSIRGGHLGLRGSRRQSVFCGQRLAQKAGQQARDLGVVRVKLEIKGFGKPRAGVIKGLSQVSGLEVMDLEDRTQVPHGGCRPRKARRL